MRYDHRTFLVDDGALGALAGAPSKSFGAAPASVFVVDADASVRDHLEGLIQRSGWCAMSFASGLGFLAQRPAPGPSCLILELTLPDLSGLEVQRRIAVDRRETPVIFITGCSDLRMMVQAMKAGAVELLPKPIDCAALLNAVRSALDASRAALAQAAEIHALQARHDSLSGREREVMALVAAGLLNKQVGGVLGISEITVKAHRGQVMRKMQARTLVDLVHMSAKLRAALRPSVERASSTGGAS
jgi:FixJ family two-component response regulator